MSTYHHGHLKKDLKERAIALIEGQGIHQFNLRHLAKLCGVSATSVYRHYKNKESLLAVIAEEGFNQLYQTMSTLEAHDKLEAMCYSYVQFGLHHSVHFNIMFGSLVDKTNNPTLVAAGNKLYQLLEMEIENNTSSEYTEGANLSRMVWATVHGITVLALDNQYVNHIESSSNANTLTDDIVKTLIGMLRGGSKLVSLDTA